MVEEDDSSGDTAVGQPVDPSRAAASVDRLGYLCADLSHDGVANAIGSPLRTILDADVGFVGLADDDAVLTLGAVSGARSGSLDGMRVQSGNGLGGHVLATGAPSAVEDYVRSTEITHEHDAEVEQEGVRGLLSVPLVVSDELVGVAYVGFRRQFSFSDAAVTEVMDVMHAASLAMSLADRARVMREEAANAARDQVLAGLRDAIDPHLGALVDGIRDILCDPNADPAIVEKASRLLGQTIEAQASIGDDLQLAVGAPSFDSPLTPRETEVIRLASTGATNAQIADTLYLAHGTVKAYMESILQKLGARNRVEAVMIAAGMDVL